MQQQSDIAELYNALLKVCQREGMQLVKSKFKNNEAIFFRYKNKIVCNEYYFNEEESENEN